MLKLLNSKELIMIINKNSLNKAAKSTKTVLKNKHDINIKLSTSTQLLAQAMGFNSHNHFLSREPIQINRYDFNKYAELFAKKLKDVCGIESDLISLTLRFNLFEDIEFLPTVIHAKDDEDYEVIAKSSNGVTDRYALELTDLGIRVIEELNDPKYKSMDVLNNATCKLIEKHPKFKFLRSQHLVSQCLSSGFTQWKIETNLHQQTPESVADNAKTFAEENHAELKSLSTHYINKVGDNIFDWESSRNRQEAHVYSSFLFELMLSSGVCAIYNGDYQYAIKVFEVGAAAAKNYDGDYHGFSRYIAIAILLDAYKNPKDNKADIIAYRPINFVHFQDDYFVDILYCDALYGYLYEIPNNEFNESYEHVLDSYDYYLDNNLKGLIEFIKVSEMDADERAQWHYENKTVKPKCFQFFELMEFLDPVKNEIHTSNFNKKFLAVLMVRLSINEEDYKISMKSQNQMLKDITSLGDNATEEELLAVYRKHGLYK